MMKRSKQGVQIAQLSTSNETKAKFKGKRRDIWSAIKQVWYIPFIWSLAWFSYWIFHESLVLGQPLTQGSNFNFIGLTISITAILIAGYISGKSGKKRVEITEKVDIEKKDFSTLHKTLSRDDSPQTLSPKTYAQKTESEEFEKRESQLKSYPQGEIPEIGKPDETPLKIAENLKTNGNIPSQSNQPSQKRKHQEIPSECLICPNLTNCDQRQKMTAESKTPCPYSKMNKN